MGKEENHIHLYNQAGRFLWKRHVGPSVTNVGISADGRRIVAGTRKGGIYIFDEEIVLCRAQANKIVRDVAITADGQWVAAGSEDGFVYGFQLPPPDPEIIEPGNTDANELYQLIIGRFSLSELKTLYFNLGIDIDDLPGQTRPEKARELVKYMDNKNQLTYLKETILQTRPIDYWDA
jgi:WD40 repeat protein